MNRLIALMMAGVVLGAVAGATDAAQGQGRGRGQEQARGTDDRRVAAKGVSGPTTQVHIVFSPRGIRLIRTHYGTRYKNLPPGLQKKLARGGPLPPGWQKKIEPFPASLERELIVLGSGHKYGVYDGHAVIYDPLTHAILDIISLL